MAEAITIIRMRKNSINNRVLHQPLIVVKELELVIDNSQVTPHSCLMLYVILLECNNICSKNALGSSN